MRVREISRTPDRLPPADDHPYRTGAWKPSFVEYDANELNVLEGAIARIRPTGSTRCSGGCSTCTR